MGHRQHNLARLHRHQDGPGDSEGRARRKFSLRSPLSRLGKPEEIAGLIIYLCSDEAVFVTGANIAVNGGQHMQ